MKKVLISGISGFVGQNLLQYLTGKGYTVHGLSRNQDTKSTFSYHELPDFNLYHAIIHCAGKAHDLKNVSKPGDYFEINTYLTQTLFDKFSASTCKKFIYLSSVKAVADSVEGILTEETIPNPKTVYGQSKLKAEKYIRSKQQPGQQVYILRPCMIHGKGNKGNLNALYKFVAKGIPYPLGDFSNKRSFLSIDNLSFIVSELLESNTPSNTFNVADDEALSTIELIKLIARVSGNKPRIWNIPKSLVILAAKAGDFLHLPLNSGKLQKLTESYIVSNKKIKTQLNCNLPLSAHEGLNKTIVAFNS